jgi:hypothetical protein
MTEVAVQVCGGSVARLAVVDDDHGPALAPELESGGEPGGRSADDGDVAVPLDDHGGVVTYRGVVTHDLDGTVHPDKRMSTCDIRKDVRATMAELNNGRTEQWQS